MNTNRFVIRSDERAGASQRAQELAGYPCWAATMARLRLTRSS